MRKVEVKQTIITEVRPLRQSYGLDFENKRNVNTANKDSTLFSGVLNDIESRLSNFSDSNTVANVLKENVRIFCWIMTAKANTGKAVAVNSTWAKRCDKVVYVTPDNVSSCP